MKISTIQYTIRNVPEPVNRYLRKRAQQSGKSLNQVIIDELSENSGVASVSSNNAFDWFIGSGMDDATLQALKEEDKTQKLMASRSLSDFRY